MRAHEKLWYNKNGLFDGFDMMHDFADEAFEFCARHHDEMAAALAFQTKIHACAQDFPIHANRRDVLSSCARYPRRHTLDLP